MSHLVPEIRVRRSLRRVMKDAGVVHFIFLALLGVLLAAGAIVLLNDCGITGAELYAVIFPTMIPVVFASVLFQAVSWLFFKAEPEETSWQRFARTTLGWCIAVSVFAMYLTADYLRSIGV